MMFAREAVFFSSNSLIYLKDCTILRKNIYIKNVDT